VADITSSDTSTVRRYVGEALDPELRPGPGLSQASRFASADSLEHLFDAFRLATSEPIRLRGEETVGSVQLKRGVDLLKAECRGQPIGVADHGNFEQKAAWTDGLFVSNSAFSKEGRVASAEARALSACTVSTFTRCVTWKDRPNKCLST
jgi:hypothetical protein